MLTLTWALLLASIPPATSQPTWSLPVAGHGDAIVVTPATDAPAPLIVVLHGSWDRPEWVCDVFSNVVRGRAWILCLRGTLRSETPPDGARWTFGRVQQTRTELKAAVSALRGWAGPRVTSGIHLLAGFSKGAGHASTLARSDPEHYPRVLLVEGGHSGGSLKRSAERQQRLAWGCGTEQCAQRANRRCTTYRRLGGDCHVETDLAYGHSYNPPFFRSGRRLFQWLTRPR